MTPSELNVECARRAGLGDLQPEDFLHAVRDSLNRVRLAARVSAFVLSWGQAQLEHGGPQMNVEDFIRLRGHRRTTFRRLSEYRELFPDTDLGILAWSTVAGERAAAAAPATEPVPAVHGRRVRATTT
jgi:hypothetical protein